MKRKYLSRRSFLSTVATGTVATAVSNSILFARVPAGKLAILGGNPVRSKNKMWPSWPYIDQKVLDSVMNTAKSGIWCRIDSRDASKVTAFEKEFAGLMGTKLSVATGSGTQALGTSVEALGIGPGDEVITSPYTDPGTVSSILTSRALPVLADLDRESFQLDPDDVERKINENTKAIMPVHIWGQPAYMDRIVEIAKKHNLRIIEDACQALLSEYQGKKLGTIGDLGCFSFQTSKTMACGEGGIIIGNDEALMDQCYTVMNHGTSRKGRTSAIGPKYRMNEFEAAVLLGQIDGVKERFLKRNENAAYLTSKFRDFKGLVPQKLYQGTTSGAWYRFAFTYKKEYFNNTERSKFLRVLAAEGISMNTMYSTSVLNKEPWTDHILTRREYQKMYSPGRLERFRDELHLPVCDLVCREIAMLNGTNVLLGTKEDMDDIVNAVMKINDNRDQLASVE